MYSDNDHFPCPICVLIAGFITKYLFTKKNMVFYPKYWCACVCVTQTNLIGGGKIKIKISRTENSLDYSLVVKSG